MDLTTLAAAIGRHVSPPPTTAVRDAQIADASVRKRVQSVLETSSVRAAGSPKPVLQLNRLPQTLNPSAFANAQSPSNPYGDLLALKRFSDLVDPVPTVSTFYSTGAMTVTDVYTLVMQSATASESWVQEYLATAQKTYRNAEIAPTSGVVDPPWHAAYATPADWYDTNQRGRFAPVKLDLATLESASSPYTIIPSSDDASLTWHVVDASGDGAPSTTDHPVTGDALSISFKGQTVCIQRPWLMELLFHLPGWSIPGEHSGFVSTGTVSQNGGVLPLLPAGFVVGYDVTVRGDFSASDRAVLDRATSGAASVSIGPFALSQTAGPTTKTRKRATDVAATPFTARRENPTTVSSPALSVVGWISDLVPQSPR